MRILLYLGLVWVPTIGSAVYAQSAATISCTGNYSRDELDKETDRRIDNDKLELSTNRYCVVNSPGNGNPYYNARLNVGKNFTVDVNFNSDGGITQVPVQIDGGKAGLLAGPRSGRAFQVTRRGVNGSIAEFKIRGRTTAPYTQGCELFNMWTCQFVGTVELRCTVLDNPAPPQGVPFCDRATSTANAPGGNGVQGPYYPPTGGGGPSRGAPANGGVNCNDDRNIAAGLCGFANQPVAQGTPPVANYGRPSPVLTRPRAIDPNAYLGGPQQPAPAQVGPTAQQAPGSPLVCGQNGIVCDRFGAIDLMRSRGVQQ